MELLEGRALLAVVSGLDAHGLLTVTSDAADPVAIASVGGQLQINGLQPTSGPAASASVQRVRIQGGPGNTLIDLAALTPATFPALTRIQASGGGGVDTLRTFDSAQRVTISGLDKGLVTDPNHWPLVSLQFSSIENISTGSGDDTIAFEHDGALSGDLDAGTGYDTLCFQDSDACVCIWLTASTPSGFSGIAPASLGGRFQGIDELIGTGLDDSLTGLDAISTWTLAQNHTYEVGASTLAFRGFELLFGGAEADHFLLVGDGLGIISATIQGGEGDDVFTFYPTTLLIGGLDGGIGHDVLDYGNFASSIDVTLTDDAPSGYSGVEPASLAGDGTFLGIDGIRGTAPSAGPSTLRGLDRLATWRLGASSTYAPMAAPTLQFSSFTNLQGGAEADDFLLLAPISTNVRGGPGNDTVRIPLDAPIALDGLFDGEAGNDTLTYEGRLTAVIADLAAAYASSITGPILGTENLTGGNGDDQLTGNAEDNILLGGPGRDLLTDGPGNDILNGGPGDDHYLLHASDSALDSLFDSDGDDTLDFSSASAGITLDIDSSAEQIVHTSARLRLTGQFENFAGSSFADALSARPILRPRNLDGAAPGSAPGDSLTIDALHQVATQTPSTLTIPGFAAVAFSRWETVSVVNAVTPIPTQADLALSVAPLPASITLGSIVRFTYTIANLGPAAAANLVLTCLLPSSSTIASIHVSAGGIIAEIGMTSQVTFASLASGAIATVTIDVRPDAAGSFEATTQVVASTPDPDPDNNRVRSNLNVLPPTDVNPRIIFATRTPLTRRPRRITLTFSADMDPASVVDLRNYRIKTSGRDHRFDTPDDRVVRLRQAFYDPATRTVHLTFRPGTRWPRRIRLTAGGPGAPGIFDNAGNRLEPNPGARPDAGFTLYFNRRRPSFNDTKIQRTGA